MTLHAVDKIHHSEIGFACSGATAPDTVVALAAAAERSGYSSLWITVLRQRTDPAAVLNAALSATTDIEVGLGLVPLDGFEAAGLARQLRDVPGRVIVGLGVGQSQHGAAAFWRAGADAFRRTAPGVRIAVGSYGPRVLHAGGALADAALLNWMTPARAAWGASQFDAGTVAAGRGGPPRPIYVYVPVAVGEGAADRIADERRAMAQHEYHRRHQAALGEAAQLGVAVDPLMHQAAMLPDFGPRARPIVLPVPAMGAEQIAEAMDAFAPRRATRALDARK